MIDSPHNYGKIIHFNNRLSSPSTLLSSPTTPKEKPRSTKELPLELQSIFSFKYFNLVQSACLDAILHSNENLVVCAPTGSGKTVILELGIIKCLLENKNLDFKVLYIAPIKALCSQKCKEWQSKFGSTKLKCGELTGDTQGSEFEYIKNLNIIVTTPEKWDSATRHWGKNKSLLESIRVVLIDEVHILNEKRGSTLEVIISRMKTFFSNKLLNTCRYIATSATIPNYKDVATWLGMPDGRAQALFFGEEYRPVTLKKTVLGIPSSDFNGFRFDISLNYKLKEIIEKHSNGKPTLIFCSTRKSTIITAEHLLKDFGLCKKQNQSKDCQNYNFKDKKLLELVEHKIAYHHAGLVYEDRRLIENLFISGKITILCSTSTLAMGVNLPARLVIIKSTLQYCNRQYIEYSELDILQMMGRAGRPQFDTEGTVVILTNADNVCKYENLCNGKQKIESQLHENLIENINAEIALGTIHDSNSALSWLKSTFYYVRLLNNPMYYGQSENSNLSEIHENINELLKKSLCKLETCGLIKQQILSAPSSGSIGYLSTDTGKSMAKFYIKYETMALISSIESHFGLESILEIISKAKEFSEIRFQVGEKGTLNNLNKGSKLKYCLKSKIKEIWHKVYLLIQIGLSDVSLTEVSGGSLMAQEIQWILSQGSRILRCVIDTLAQKSFPSSLVASIRLLGAINSQCWPESEFIFKQLSKIGKSYSLALYKAGIQSFSQLLATESRRLEIILGRNPPFGNQIKNSVRALPWFSISNSPAMVLNEQYIEITVSVGLSSSTSDHDVKALSGYKKNQMVAHFIINGYDIVSSQSYIINYERILLGRLVDKKDIKLRFSKENYSKIEIQISLYSEDYIGIEAYKTIKPTESLSVSSSDHGLANNPFMENNDDDRSASVFGSEELSTDHITSKSESKKSNSKKTDSSKTNSEPPLTPVSLKAESPSTCKHKCHDKTKCGHNCCKSGSSLKRKSKSDEARVENDLGKRTKDLEEETYRSKSPCYKFNSSLQKDECLRLKGAQEEQKPSDDCILLVEETPTPDSHATCFYTCKEPFSDNHSTSFYRSVSDDIKQSQFQECPLIKTANSLSAIIKPFFILKNNNREKFLKALDQKKPQVCSLPTLCLEEALGPSPEIVLATKPLKTPSERSPLEEASRDSISKKVEALSLIKEGFSKDPFNYNMEIFKRIFN